MRVAIKLTGDEDAVRRMQDVLRETSDLRPLWNRIRKAFYRAETQRFASAGEGGWPLYNWEYSVWKAKHYPGKRFLEMTGGFMASLTSAGGYNVFTQGRFSMRVGTVHPLANIHENRKTNPRQLIDADSPLLLEHMETATDDWLEWLARKWGEG